MDRDRSARRDTAGKAARAQQAEGCGGCGGEGSPGYSLRPRTWRRRRRVVARQPEHCVREPAPETIVVHELLEEFGVVLEYCRHHSTQRLVVLDACILFVRVLLRVLVGRIGGHASRDVLVVSLCAPTASRQWILPKTPSKLLMMFDNLSSLGADLKPPPWLARGRSPHWSQEVGSSPPPASRLGSCPCRSSCGSDRAVPDQKVLTLCPCRLLFASVRQCGVEAGE